jgi:hypothetical protein
LDTQQLDSYKGLIGDGKGRITVSKEISESDFGKGGKTMVSISLTCDQSHPAINAAVNMADQLATYWANVHHDNLRNFLHQKGVLR